jgi:hypothetical protein
MISNVSIMKLKPPFDYVALYLWPDGRRYCSRKAKERHSIPDEPPETTLGLAFPIEEAAAGSFTKISSQKKNIVPIGLPSSSDQMPPAPECSYYWPPSIDTCIKNYEYDISAKSGYQIPIKRVIILGAGFSAAFQFSTSNTIIKGVTNFFENWHPSPWYDHLYARLVSWLDLNFPHWRQTPPSLYKFLESFDAIHVKSYSKNYDPIYLFYKNISWESNNYDAYVKNPLNSLDANTQQVLYSFEALLAVYLLYGRLQKEVEVPWAIEFFKNVRPTDAILTFNWDVIPEVLMVTADKPFCRYDWTSNRTKFIKLHGSADLFGAPNIIMRGDCQALPERFECISPLLWRARTSEDVLVRTHQWPFGRALPPSERYNKASVLIMPPCFPMGYGYKLIQFNWRKARTALERAKEIYIVGYSLSDQDFAFHNLIKDVSKKWDSQVTVDVWNTNPLVGTKAEELFGRNRVVFHQNKASEFNFR